MKRNQTGTYIVDTCRNEDGRSVEDDAIDTYNITEEDFTALCKAAGRQS